MAGTEWIEVVAAVIERADGSFLLAQRPPGKVYAGWWEFPGGKVEAGEPPARALARELEEELGLAVESAYPWITRTFRYPHGNVRLRFYRVVRWHGEPRSREGQAFEWQHLPHLSVAPVLPANGPVLSALALPVRLGVTQAQDMGVARFLERLDAALAGGLRLVQVREPGMPGPALAALVDQVVARVHAAGGRVVVNATHGLAGCPQADGLHVPARYLPGLQARPSVALVGASVHDEAELDHAERLGLDYAILGPVAATPSHPGLGGLGFDRFRALATGRTLPVFAIGGLGWEDLEPARSAGAHGIAAIRAAWAV